MLAATADVDTATNATTAIGYLILLLKPSQTNGQFLVQLRINDARGRQPH